MTPWFIATERFSPAKGDTWGTYVSWSGLTQLDEVVSLDPMLCPTLLPDIKANYWPHIVNQDFLLNFFVDLAFLRREIDGLDDRNLLCVYCNPEEPPPMFDDPQPFEFLGYDLVDVQCSASALTNCGGFPGVFANDELSPKGLLTSHARALEVQAALRAAFPDEPHANCHVWAISRAIES